MLHFVNGINQEFVFFTKQSRKKITLKKALRAALKIYIHKKQFLNIYPDLLHFFFNKKRGCHSKEITSSLHKDF